VSGVKRDGKWLQFFKFLFFSLGAAVIDFGSFALLIWLLPNAKTYTVIAAVTSVALSCLFNFTLNRKYTFRSVNNIKLGMLMYGLFYLVLTPCMAQLILLQVHFGIPELLAKPVSMVVNFFCDYAFCRFVLFRPWGGKKTAGDGDSKG